MRLYPTVVNLHMLNNSSLKQVVSRNDVFATLSIIGVIMIAIGSFVIVYPIMKRKRRLIEGKGVVALLTPSESKKARQEWSERNYALVGVIIIILGTIITIIGIVNEV